MKVAGDYMFDAPPETVWKGLMDPKVLAATMPGCEKLELVGEDQYEGELNIKVGPVQGKFKGKIQLENIDEPSSYDMKVDGQGAQGFVRATAHVSIAAEDGQTRLSYEGDAQIGGRIAGVGQRLLDSSAKAIIKQSLGGLNEQLAAGQGGGEEAAAQAAAPAAQPSQAEFAAGVAKEVAKDLVPKPVWIAIAIAALLLILYFLLG